MLEEIFNGYSIAFVPIKEVRNLKYKHIHSVHCVFGVIHMLLLINLYFSLNLDFFNVSKTFYTFEKLLGSIKIALKVA